MGGKRLIKTYKFSVANSQNGAIRHQLPEKTGKPVPAERYHADRSEFPRVRRWLDTIAERPAVRREAAVG